MSRGLRHKFSNPYSQFSIYLCYSSFVNATVSESPEINDEARWSLIYRRAQEVKAVEAFGLFREQGIEPVLIKGLAAGRFYPGDKARQSIDMDIAVAADDFEAANAVAVAAGPKGLAIDLHRELRHLDTVAWDDLFANSQLLDVEGGTIRVLRPEDGLRVLIVHWLTNGGAERDRLWDVYYAIANRPADFDWDRFLNVVGPNRRRWLVCTVGLAHRFLGLDIDDTPIADEARDVPEWLVKTVEREWASSTPFVPLEFAISDPKTLLKQIPRRLRPDPIWATIQMEGSFDARTRAFYQIGSFFKRLMPSYRRVSKTIRSRRET